MVWIELDKLILLYYYLVQNHIFSHNLNNLINFLTNSFTTLYELVEIFPIECRVSLLAFLGVASAYLAYKIIKGG